MGGSLHMESLTNWEQTAKTRSCTCERGARLGSTHELNHLMKGSKTDVQTAQIKASLERLLSRRGGSGPCAYTRLNHMHHSIHFLLTLNLCEQT